MGFLSFHERYYAGALDRLEGRALGPEEVYEAKQLLKLLDDLADEGYPALGRALEEKAGAVSRLRAILAAHGERPFSLPRRPPLRPGYGGAEAEPEALCRQLTDRAARGVQPADDPFLGDLRRYCQWLGRQPGTAYVFLLRDAFLPYLYYRSTGGGELYPWVINRDFLGQLAGPGTDDRLRLPVYEALERGVTDFAGFSAFCKERIRAVLRDLPALEAALRALLATVRAERILVVESGYCGTVPLTLSALDDRVDFRLYTTAPYLYTVYRDRIFCRRYEQIRSFETLYAQDRLMTYAALRDGRFYVRAAGDEAIWDRAAGEAAALLGG